MVTGTYQARVWCFTCPTASCRLTECGFADCQYAENALRDHLDEYRD